MDGGAVIFEVVLMLRPELFKLDPEIGLEGFREGDDAMFAAFGIVDLDSVVVEIQVLDSQGHGFAHAQPGTIHELSTEEPRGL